MQDNTRTAWTQLLPWLDDLLTLDEADRSARMATIAAQDSALAEQLQQMLAQLDALDASGFMQSPAQAMGSAAAAAAGQVVGAYTLQSLLGEGGMGAVWLAQRSDGRFQGQAAIKFLHGGQRSPALARRFAREAELLARLSHPNIARLLDAGLMPGDQQPYLVLEYVEGQPIDAWCASQALDLPARLQLLLAVMDAVAHAHEHLVLHRDLKPSNILVNTQGAVKLLDFGIARVLGDSDAGEPELTRLGGAAYTPRWASPEQVNGGELTSASDVYALGVLAHLLLTGLHPMGDMQPGRSVQQLRAWLEAPTPLASQHLQACGTAADRPRVRALRGDLDTLIAKALKKPAAERYRNAAEMADDLRRHLRHQPILARPDSAVYRANRFLRRHWLAVGAASAVGAALVVGGGVALLQAREAQAQRAQAEGLLEYMLGDLRDKLEPLGQLPVLDGVGTRALAYYAGQPLQRLDDLGLTRRSEALHVLGRVAQQRGRIEDMARIGEQARAGSALLLQRQPQAPDALRLNASSLALVAWAAELQGRLDEADQHYQQALRWSAQALALRPGDPDLRLAEADVQGEFAAFCADRGGEWQLKALPWFDREYQTLKAFAPQRDALWQRLASNRAWVADTLYGLGRYDEALLVLREQREALARLPGLNDKPTAQWDAVAAMNRESGALLALDRPAEAEAVSAQAVARGGLLVAGDPSNADWAVNLGFYLEQHATTLAALGRTDAALGELQAARQRLAGVVVGPGGETSQLKASWLRVLAAWVRLQPQDTASFNRLHQRLSAELARPPAAGPRSQGLARDVGRASLAVGRWWAARGRHAAAQQVWAAGLQALSSEALRREPLPMRLELLVALGRRDEARAEAQALQAAGWKRPLPAF